MKRLRTLLLVCVAAMLSVFALASCSANQDSGIPQTSSPSISTPTIGTDGTLRVGVDAQNAPFAYQNSNRIIGLDVDTAAAVADQLGLKLELVDVGSDPTSAIDDGSVDVVMDIDPDTISSEDYWVSNPYVQSAPALFATTQNNIPSTTSTPVIVAQTNSYSSSLVSDQYGNDALTLANDLSSAFSQLQNGQASYVACDAVIGTYLNYTQNYGAHIVGLLQSPSGYCFACNSNNSALSNAISNALSTLQNNGVISVIQSKWLGSLLDLSATPLTEGASSTAQSASNSSSTNSNQVSSSAGSNVANLQEQSSSSQDESNGQTSTSGQGAGTSQETSENSSGSGTGSSAAGTGTQGTSTTGTGTSSGTASNTGSGAATGQSSSQR